MNESMLTGESVPVMKSAPSRNSNLTGNYSYENDCKYTLYAGTKIIQKREAESSINQKEGSRGVLGLVIKTSFQTKKGNLVRDILYPKPNRFKFYRDSLFFVGAMALVAIFGFSLTLPSMIN